MHRNIKANNFNAWRGRGETLMLSIFLYHSRRASHCICTHMQDGADAKNVSLETAKIKFRFEIAYAKRDNFPLPSRDC